MHPESPPTAGPNPPPVHLWHADGHHLMKPRTQPLARPHMRDREMGHTTNFQQWREEAPLRNPAVHLGDLLLIWVRPGARFTPSPPDFQGPARAHWTPPEPQSFPGLGPISWVDPNPGSLALHKEKRILPGAPTSFSWIDLVTTLDASRCPSPPVRGHSESSLRSVGPISIQKFTKLM
uniref:Uncharacterized protein n=1 Tax=Oncorhynchus tshawytscha TaxID=74940 RepID=A0A8C8MI02_ONCTS